MNANTIRLMVGSLTILLFGAAAQASRRDLHQFVTFPRSVLHGPSVTCVVATGKLLVARDIRTGR